MKFIEVVGGTPASIANLQHYSKCWDGNTPKRIDIKTIHRIEKVGTRVTSIGKFSESTTPLLAKVAVCEVYYFDGVGPCNACKRPWMDLDQEDNESLIKKWEECGRLYKVGNTLVKEEDLK